MNQQNIPAFTVTDLNRYIKSLITADEVLSSVTVRGEISNFKAHTSGHLYFTIKDEGAELSAVMFRADAARLPFRPTNGMNVLVYGNVDVYEKSGRVQVYVRTMMADGVGALAQAYERLKKKLEAEGLFSEERKKPLPAFPERIGVITAPTGAAIRDILNITGRRYPQAKVILYPSLVQGPDAPQSLLAGVEYFNAAEACDVIILGRGGGSIEDLWAFNDESLVRAVAASKIPVISAVGHETDFTLCDFAADRRAPTPSAAAELAVPDRAVLQGKTAESFAQLSRLMDKKIRTAQFLLDSRAKSLALLSPEGRLQRNRKELGYMSDGMERAMAKILQRDQARLRASVEQLGALNPLAILQRGYSAVRDADGHVLASVERLEIGQSVELLMRDGMAKAEIREILRKDEHSDARK
ncbi:MAG: exodeoxyribonuclease VII large subunit [Clostridia bacterium]|nr:exodeoxyribonuclease VII large subunit [Clostridia bacterium]